MHHWCLASATTQVKLHQAEWKQYMSITKSPQRAQSESHRNSIMNGNNIEFKKKPTKKTIIIITTTKHEHCPLLSVESSSCIVPGKWFRIIHNIKKKEKKREIRREKRKGKKKDERRHAKHINTHRLISYGNPRQIWSLVVRRVVRKRVQGHCHEMHTETSFFWP